MPRPSTLSRVPLVALVALVAAPLVVPRASARARVPGDDARLGLVYEGLTRSSVDGLCRGAFESLLDAGGVSSMTRFLCTHGPDPAPDGIDVRENRGPDPAAELAPPPGAGGGQDRSVPCEGTGSDGFRVQLVYARSSTTADRFSTYWPSFKAWAGRLDGVVAASAAETGGTRHVRFVTDAACDPVVARVTLSPAAMSSFTTMVTELHGLGYARSDRKYLVWADANVYCGISELYADDTADATPGVNQNNGNPRVQGAVGRIDNGCWGLADMVEAHELVHLLGGVQPSAPHATPSFHCLDESDRLCYADGSTSSPVVQSCPSSHERLYDCNHDDYFSTDPVPGSYLSRHWNVADSAFLSRSAPRPPPPSTTTTTVTATSTTTVTAVTRTTSTTSAPTTTVAPSATLPAPPPGPAAPPAPSGPPAPSVAAPPSLAAPPSIAPSAPRALTAGPPGVGTGVSLAWEVPARGPVSGYRVYRGASPWDQILLATVGDVYGYHDASAGPTVHFYRVSAFNDAGEGPSSAATAMIGTTGRWAGTVSLGDLGVVGPRNRLDRLLAWRWA